MVQPEAQQSSPEKVCLLCSDRSSTQYNLKVFDKHGLYGFIEKGINMKVPANPALPNSVCCSCLCRLNFHFEFQNRAQRNILNLKIKYYTQKNDRRMINYLTKKKNKQKNSDFEKFRKTLDQSRAISAGDLFDSFRRNEQEFLSAMSDSTDTEEDESTDTDGDSTILISESNYEHEQQERRESVDGSLLEPMYQMSESLRDTESGGNIHTENAINAARSPIKCCYCPKICHPQHMARHVRTHSKVIRQKTKKQVESKIYECDVVDCGQIFTTLKAIRKHYKTHEKKSICPGCNQEFCTWNELKWHIIVCKASQMTAENSIRRTRSRSRLDSVSSFNDSDNQTGMSDDSTSTNDMESDVDSLSTFTIDSVGTSTIYNKRLRRIETQMNQQNSNETESMNVYDEGDDENIRPMRTGESSSMTQTSNSYWYSNAGRSTRERRKKIRAGKKAAKKQGKQYFACAFSNSCTFGSTSMAKTMYHEVKAHKGLLLFKCNECQQSFTTNQNLIRHRTKHLSKMSCALCHNFFDSRYSLQIHTIQHHEQSYSCRYCNMSFLRPNELKTHEYELHQHASVPLRCGIVVRRKSSRFENTNNLDKSLLPASSISPYSSKELIQNKEKSSQHQHSNQHVKINNTNSNNRHHRQIIYKKVYGRVPNTNDVNLFDTKYWDINLPKIADKLDRQTPQNTENNENDHQKIHSNYSVESSKMEIENFDLFSIENLNKTDESRETSPILCEMNSTSYFCFNGPNEWGTSI